VLPALFIVAAAVLLYYSFTSNLRSSLVGTAIILTGLPVYRVIRARYRQPA
jgi:APA family basic amino acid/polyamine antiporter